MLRRFSACLTAVLLLTALTGCVEDIPPAESVPDFVIDIPGLTTAPPETTVTTTTTTLPPFADEAHDIENGVLIENVPHQTQFTEYLTACESVAAVNLLRYYGVDITPDEFLDGFLPVADYPSLGEDGELHAESPWEYFIGDPNQKNAYGCYNGALVKAINKIRDGLAVSLDDVDLDELCHTYIDNGEPVIIWATINMAPSRPGHEWIMPNGERYTFISPEHALVMVGYDDNYYYFSDSLQYPEIAKYARQAVETAYDALYRQAVVIDMTALSQVPDFWRIKEQNADTES